MWDKWFQDSPGLFLWCGFENVKWAAFAKHACSCYYMDLHRVGREIQLQLQMWANISQEQIALEYKQLTFKKHVSVLAEDESMYRFLPKIRLTSFLKLPLCRCRSLTLVQCVLSVCSYRPLSLEEQNYTLFCHVELVLPPHLVLAWLWVSAKEPLTNSLQIWAPLVYRLCCQCLSRQSMAQDHWGRFSCSYLNWPKQEHGTPLLLCAELVTHISFIDVVTTLLPNCFTLHRWQSIETRLWEMCGPFTDSDRLVFFWACSQLGPLARLLNCAAFNTWPLLPVINPTAVIADQ